MRAGHEREQSVAIAQEDEAGGRRLTEQRALGLARPGVGTGRVGAQPADPLGQAHEAYGHVIEDRLVQFPAFDRGREPAAEPPRGARHLEVDSREGGADTVGHSEPLGDDGAVPRPGLLQQLPQEPVRVVAHNRR